MNTCFLGREQVACYLADMATRLETLPPKSQPAIWCPIGHSGEVIAFELLKQMPSEQQERVTLVPLQCNKDGGNGENILSGQADEETLRNKNVLVLDAAVHSGTSMLAAVQKIEQCGAAEILTYTLVLKRGSCFVPNWFGLVIDDHDRALFLLEAYPNNRLMRHAPFGRLRVLREKDVHREPRSIETGLKSIDQTTWGDLLYDSTTKGSHVYLFEIGQQIKASISFRLTSEKSLFIDAIAVEQQMQRRGVGGVLLRWAETWARSMNCHEIELWAIEDRVLFYQGKGFEATLDKLLDLGGGERYQKMRRRLLYNLNDAEECRVRH